MRQHPSRIFSRIYLGNGRSALKCFKESCPEQAKGKLYLHSGAAVPACPQHLGVCHPACWAHIPEALANPA